MILVLIALIGCGNKIVINHGSSSCAQSMLVTCCCFDSISCVGVDLLNISLITDNKMQTKASL